MPQDQLYFVGQKAFIEKEGKILVLNVPGEGLDFPGGKIQQGETDLEASLKREVREETGLEIEVGKPFTVWTYQLSNSHLHSGKKVYLVGFKCKYLSGEITLSSEHDHYQWVNADDYQKLDDHTEYFQALKKYFS